MQNVELNELNLPSKWLNPLTKGYPTAAGYITASEILLSPPQVLVTRTRLSSKDVLQILLEVAQAVSDTPLAKTSTVMQLAGPKYTFDPVQDVAETGAAGARLELWRERRNFTVGDAAIDTLLGDGIQLGCITEISGQSASGKSHLCLQLALTAQLPPALGGVSGGTIYISSEGIIPSNRLLSLAQCLCASVTHGDGGDDHDNETQITPWDMLDNVHMEKATDVETLQSLLAYVAPAQIDRINAAALDMPPRELRHMSSKRRRTPLPIRLIVVDSIAAPFRVSNANDSSGFVKRAEELGDVGDQLKRLAHVYDCAVVVVNQVSDVFDRGPPRPPPSPGLHVGSPGARSTQTGSPSSTPSAAPSTPSTPRPPPPAHVQNNLPPYLYSRFQTPHFSGQTPSFRALASLGHSWSNIVNTRVMLWRTKRRRAIEDDADSYRSKRDPEAGNGTELIRRMALIFSPYAPRATVEFVIRAQGVVSVGEVRLREPRWAGYASVPGAENALAAEEGVSESAQGVKSDNRDGDDELWAALGDVDVENDGSADK